MAREQKTIGLEVELGGESYTVVPQRHARLTRRLFGEGGVFGSIEEVADQLTDEATFDSLYSLVGGRVYETLCVFIPDFMPRWHFDGYASEQLAEEDRYDEQADRSPTVPEIQTAFRCAIQINGLEWLGKLKGLVDPKVIRNQLTLMVASMGSAAREAAASSPISPSLPQANGASDPTTSGTSEPTPPPPSDSDGPSDSPSPDSSSLQTPTAAVDG